MEVPESMALALGAFPGDLLRYPHQALPQLGDLNPCRPGWRVRCPGRRFQALA